MMTTTTLRIATAQYEIGCFSDWQQYVQKQQQWITAAVTQQAQLLLFPEYAAMELVSLFDNTVRSSLSLQLEALQTLHAQWRMLWRDLAVQHQVYVLPGTFPVRMADGSYRNRATLFTPQGEQHVQDKLHMTRFENEQWLISPGNDIHVFDTAFGKVGINICYDAEFPCIAQQQCQRGAQLILVPSCTDTLAGHHRVRIGCQARALENQCYVVQASTVGEAPWSEAVDINIGAAAVYTPADRGFPDDGVLVYGTLNVAQWVYADLDFARVAQVRENGQVLNFRDGVRAE